MAVHLVGLCLALEHGSSPTRVIAERQRALRDGATYTWLEPPADPGALTIVDVHAATDLTEHEEGVRRWAASVWSAWAPHHAQIRKWARMTQTSSER